MADGAFQDTYRPIDDYGCIGDSRTAALVGSSGSIDWLCVPEFDGPPLFSRLLDLRDGGFWHIQPTVPYHAGHRYLDETNILETRFVATTGTARLLDFMPMRQREGSKDPSHPSRALIRVVEGVAGTLELESVCALRPDFGRQTARLTAQGTLLSGAGCLVTGPASWRVDEAASSVGKSTITIKAGERLAFVLRFEEEEGEQAARAISQDAAFALLDETRDFWRSWARHCRYEGPYKDAVVRSALALRLLIYGPTGAIVAAPTTSLPERVGGPLNWDYRYAWLRDASLTLEALLLAGFSDEMDAAFDWIARTIEIKKDTVTIMYPIRSHEQIDEQELDEVEGYRGSRPVHIGNAASGQIQLDAYGAVLDALHFAWKARGYDVSTVWEHFHPLADWVADHWRERDEGIWEVRGGGRDFVYSKMMTWVALDRAIKIAEGCALPGDVARWRDECAKIHADVLERGWNAELGAFAQSYEDAWLDASNLRFSAMGFIAGDDPRMVATIDRTLDGLTDNALCYRYLQAPGTDGQEGTFTVCGFWLVHALLLAGRTDEARGIFEAMLRDASPLGLYAEEIDAATRLQLGNFPQALSHIGLIGAATALAHAGVAGRVAPEHSHAVANARSSAGVAPVSAPAD